MPTECPSEEINTNEIILREAQLELIEAELARREMWIDELLEFRQALVEWGQSNG